MTVYDRSGADTFREVNTWPDGFGWFAHPDERGERASHAIRGDDGVWLVDPIDAPGIDARIEELGDVAGVAVLSNWHARDAGEFAARHDVAVHLPDWMTRVSDLVDVRVERYERYLGDSGFQVDHVTPLPGWHEGVAYRDSDGTLYTPDLLTTSDYGLVGDERLGLTLPSRPFPPRAVLEDCQPARVLVGHGNGVFENADAALEDAVDNARRRFPRALLTQGPAFFVGVLGAILD
jgi:hypothetical protein